MNILIVGFYKFLHVFWLYYRLVFPKLIDPVESHVTLVNLVC